MAKPTVRERNFSPLTKLVAGALLIGLSAVFVRLLKSEGGSNGPVAIAFWRMFFGGLVLVPLGLRQAWAGRLGARESSLIILAALIFAADLTVWHASIERIGPGLATILGNLQAVILAVIGLTVYREKGAPRVLSAVVLALIALLMLTHDSWSGGSGDYRLGVFLGLGTALCYSAYLLTLRKLGDKNTIASPIQRMLLISFASAIFLACFAILGGDSLLLEGPGDYGLVFIYGALCQGLAWVWISGSVASLPASISGLVLLLQPAVSLGGDILFFDRGLTGLELGGMVLAGLAIWFGSSEGKRRK